ncbi:hypothetical protein LTR66_011642 [Elasticomyces elasticus]|nr:hypothetical protein LTR66_011642 [Elasticomyces elasticus]
MSDFGDDYTDEPYGFDDDYLYVEDAYAMADDLAEHAIASPPYSPDELEEQFIDYDIYNFWGDLEYGSDEYYDRALTVAAAADATKSGEKRKRADDSDQNMPEKRQKLSRSKGVTAVSAEQENPFPPIVLWQSADERARLDRGNTPVLDATREPVTLLKDWQERFKDAKGFSTPPNSAHQTPAWKAFQEASEHGSPPTSRRPQLGMPSPPSDGDWEDEGDEDGMDIEPELLKVALREKLASAGIGAGANQAAFMESIMRMVSDGGAADDVAAELATKLLEGNGEDGPQSELSFWLAQQGVSLRDEVDDEDQSVDAGAMHAEKVTPSSQLSPPDSALNIPSTGSQEKTDTMSSEPVQAQPKDTANEVLTQPAPETPRTQTPPSASSSRRHLAMVLIEIKSTPSAQNQQQTPAKPKKKVTFAIPEKETDRSSDAEQQQKPRRKATPRKPRATASTAAASARHTRSSKPAAAAAADAANAGLGNADNHPREDPKSAPYQSSENALGTGTDPGKGKGKRKRTTTSDDDDDNNNDRDDDDDNKNKNDDSAEPTASKRQESRAFAAPTASSRGKAAGVRGMGERKRAR